MLSDNVTFQDFKSIAEKYPNKYVTQFIMDQKLYPDAVTILNQNHYIDQCYLHIKKMNQINNEDLLILYNQIKYVINASYQSQGATIANF